MGGKKKQKQKIYIYTGEKYQVGYIRRFRKKGRYIAQDAIVKKDETVQIMD